MTDQTNFPDRLTPRRRWKHIYRCLKSSLHKTHGFAQLCFLCRQWITDKDEYNQHRQAHLSRPKTLPIQCGYLELHQMLAIPGYCPHCLDKLPAEPMRQYLCPQSLERHLAIHYKELEEEQKLGGGKVNCGHPRCSMSFDSVENLRCHDIDTHCIAVCKRSTAKKRPQRASETDMADGKPEQLSPSEYKFTIVTVDSMSQATNSIRPLKKRRLGQRSIKCRLAKQPSPSMPESCSVNQPESDPLDGADGVCTAAATPSGDSSTSWTSWTTDQANSTSTAYASPVSSVSLDNIDPLLLPIQPERPSVPHSCPGLPLGESEAVCPICRSTVTMDLLMSYTRGKRRMPVRRQMEFCIAHRRETARHEWAECRYPAIAWDTLEDHLTQFHDVLHKMLNSDIHSLYRDSLREHLKGLHGRRFQPEASIHHAGYYEPRGRYIL